MPPARPTLVHCTNGYPLEGDDRRSVLASVGPTAAEVRAAVDPDAVLPIGLYLPALAAEELIRPEAVAGFNDRLGSSGVEVRTMNGFPFATFHRPGGAGDAYRPAWDDPRRVDHAANLAALLVDLLPGGVTEASISTLPIGWGAAGVDLEAAALHLREAAARLRALRDRSGVRVTLDLEPEPGCVLGDAAAAVGFFGRWLPGEADRAHLGVCHDVCHAAVVGEAQGEALAAYRAAGISVHKVQLSSAPQVFFEGMDAPIRDEAVALLRTLPGDRSLRQTVVTEHGESAFFADLDDALAAHPQPGGVWRVHHHLPLTLGGFGPVRTTRDAVGDCLDDLAAHGETPILETETYTWLALPAALRADTLAGGLAAELRWAGSQIDRAWGG